jgi:hypothetical protein
MLLYLWLILTLPHDRMICSLWITLPPSQSELMQSCGTANLSPFVIRVVYNGQVICNADSASLYTVHSDCGLTLPLSQYRLNIVEPDFQDAICSVTTPTNTQPTKSEIERQCPDATKHKDIVIKPWGTKTMEPEPGMCKPPATVQPSNIATDHELHLLAAKLIWYGYVKPDCKNGSLSSPLSPTPCGLDAARPMMVQWQNSMDAEIVKAASEWNVSAIMLKQMIENETQFWSWTNSPQEHGLIQATDYAAFAVLHVYSRGYYSVTPTQRASQRAAWLRNLDCDACDPKQTIEHAKQVMSIYAQTLAAYYCMYGNWNDALRAWNIKYQQVNP